METNKTKIMVYLYIVSDSLDFEKITNKLAIQPTSITEAKDIKVKKYRRDYWTYSTGYVENESKLSKVFAKITSVFVKKEDVIQEVCKEQHADVGINIVIYKGNDIQTKINLSKENIQFANTIGAKIGFDIYEND